MINFRLSILTLMCLASHVIATEPAKSPADVFARYQKALADQDGAAALDCLSEPMRLFVLFESAFVAQMNDSEFLETHIDPKLEKVWLERYGVPKSTVDRRRFVGETLRDPSAFLSAACKRFPKQISEPEPLRNVTQNGDRAQGIVTARREERRTEGGVERTVQVKFDSARFFAKSRLGWRIDLPTDAELKADVERLSGSIAP